MLQYQQWAWHWQQAQRELQLVRLLEYQVQVNEAWLQRWQSPPQPPLYMYHGLQNGGASSPVSSEHVGASTEDVGASTLDNKDEGTDPPEDPGEADSSEDVEVDNLLVIPLADAAEEAIALVKKALVTLALPVPDDATGNVTAQRRMRQILRQVATTELPSVLKALGLVAANFASDEDTEKNAADALKRTELVTKYFCDTEMVIMRRGVQDVFVLACSRLLPLSVLKCQGIPDQLKERWTKAWGADITANRDLWSRLGQSKSKYFTPNAKWGKKKARSRVAKDLYTLAKMHAPPGLPTVPEQQEEDLTGSCFCDLATHFGASKGRALDISCTNGIMAIVAASNGCHTIVVEETEILAQTCRRNYDANSIPSLMTRSVTDELETPHGIVQGDAWEYLLLAQARGEKFEIIICPPDGLNEVVFSVLSDCGVLVVYPCTSDVDSENDKVRQGSQIRHRELPL